LVCRHSGPSFSNPVVSTSCAASPWANTTSELTMITAAPIIAAEHRIMSLDESAFLIFSLSLRLA
jgi:hypothetical protein